MADTLQNTLCRYLRQQRELGLPDLIFSAPLVLPSPRKVAVPSLPESRFTAPPPAQSTASRPHRARPVAQLTRHLDAPPASGKPADSSKRDLLKDYFFSVRQCSNCPLANQRNKMVFGGGSADAPLMIIGEAPGADEDRQGIPFVGRAGQLLTRMLAAIDLDRAHDVFITNILKCRPPGNRNPETGEILSCLPVLTTQIDIIRPRAFLLLGRIAANTLLDCNDSIGSMRRRTHHYRDIPAVVTYHPAALLRNESYKRPAWEDLQRLSTILGRKGDTHAAT